MMLKEQRSREKMRRFAERRKVTDRRKSSNMDYLLLNYEKPDMRSGKDRRVK